jgi:putative ABC transport system substrate-binding protein
MPIIGYISNMAPGEAPQLRAAFHQGLKETGFIEGKNVIVEYRWAEEHYDRLPGLVGELIHPRVAVIAAASTAAALAAKAATTRIPIVFESAGDPVRFGLVANLSRPDGNVTDVTQANQDTEPKRLELLHELLPTTRALGVLVNPADPRTDGQLNEVQSAARTLGLELHVMKASTAHDFDEVFTSLIQLRVGGLAINTNILFTGQSEQLAALAARYAMPAIYKGREFAAAGGLLSYGTASTESYRLTGVYTGRILSGEKPADLPVQQVSKIELIINLKTAKALGVTVPLPLLGRADEVIE